MDERAQDLEQEPQASASRCDEPQPRLPEATPAAPPARPPTEPFPCTFKPQHILPQAAGGGAGGVVAQVLFAPEPTRAKPFREAPPPAELPEPQASPTVADPPNSLFVPPSPAGELANDPVPPTAAPEPEAPSELPALVEAAIEPALIEEIPLAAFAPLPRPAPSSVGAPVLQPIDEDRDRHTDPLEQPSPVQMSPEAPDMAEPASASVAPPPYNEAVGDLVPPPEARAPVVAPTNEPTLLDQIPSVQASQPEPATSPPPIAPVLQRIEPYHVRRSDPGVQPSPVVVAPTPEIFAPLSHRSPRRCLPVRRGAFSVDAYASRLWRRWQSSPCSSVWCWR